MINPVVLIETGHSYEAANIIRWLDMHSTCPMTGLQLHSKQLSSNRVLRHLITGWAAAHGIVLPAAPMYTPLLPVGPSPATMRTAQPDATVAQALPAVAPPSMPHTVLSMPHLEGSNSISRDTPVADQQQQLNGGSADNPGKDPAGGSLAVSYRNGSKPGMLRCTRTRWAVALFAVLVVLGVAIGVGVGVGAKQIKGKLHVPKMQWAARQLHFCCW
jgi:hypothetical protein